VTRKLKITFFKFNQIKLILGKKDIILNIFGQKRTFAKISTKKNQKTETIIEGSPLKNQADDQPSHTALKACHITKDP